MKKIGLILFLAVPLSAEAGYFVEKSMYVETYITVGRGLTREDAQKDAESAIPSRTKWIYFEPNSQWASPVYQCMNGGSWSEAKECNGGKIQVILPLRRIEQ